MALARVQQAVDLEQIRARPWLGTLVEVRVGGLEQAHALQLIDAAFAEIAMVHRCMSFHAPDSDLARLHAAAPGSDVTVDPRTWNVLQAALQLAAQSRGCFDPTIAAELVAWGFLPMPASPFIPDPSASWFDIALLPGHIVRLRRPLWIDLGGIAKGYAVDRALALLRAGGAGSAGVNAGGDLALFGAHEHIIHVRAPQSPQVGLPLLALADGAVASSAGYFQRRRGASGWLGPHVHGRRRRAIGTHSAVSVIAPCCMHADALTKVALADPALAATLLPRYAAQACRYDARHGWRSLLSS